MTLSELNCKEVINITSGQRLGFVSDVQICLPEGQAEAIIVPGPCRFLGLGGRNDDYVIPWKCIKRIGPDIILVDIRPEECRCPRRSLFAQCAKGPFSAENVSC